MAYISQEEKKEKEPLIKAILKKYGLKGSLAVPNYITLVLNIRAGKIDFLKNYNDITLKDFPEHKPVKYIDVNIHSYKKYFTGTAQECLTELFNVLYVGNHDNSDPMTDYFDVGWYVDLRIGRWDKPYEVKDSK